MKTHLRLTDRQRAIYEFIDEYHAVWGHGPTIQEICINFNDISDNTVNYQVRSLELQGLVASTGYSKFCTIESLRQRYSPLRRAGRLVSGIPMLTTSSREPIDFSYLFNHANNWIVTVHGDDLKNEALLDGDEIIFSQKPVAYPGDMAIIRGTDGKCHLVRITSSDPLQGLPCSPTVKPGSPLVIEGDHLVGVRVGVIRRV